MNLRTLKKLSKRAAPLLVQLGDGRERFRARPYENYHGCFIGDRKHSERGRCHETYEGRNGWTTPRGAEIVFTTRAGRRMLMSVPAHPRKGTIMVGATSGYYEPEWDEECAWAALETLVRHHFTDWEMLMADDDEDEDDGLPVGGALTRDLSTPSKILAAARDMVAEREAELAARAAR